ncbi:histidine kinase dimerization/phospho-acceptor domain-containing protein [Variovorax sp. PvP013]|jgi:light-regulated signal transduction histidine kinase (bacteriophytochrome)|uniref:histidine kinase dimerization/phospho-acceptor domain-containing protein n=1 Tax=Variovorax sp. PvP013 TaxID=3156435 RepID=UPI003D25D295
MPILPSEPSGDRGDRPPPIPCDPAVVAFLRRFDHDLRTPLGTMAAAVELLRDDPSDPELRAASIAVLERQIARMHALTHELREISRRCVPPGGDARSA